MIFMIFPTAEIPYSYVNS